ncbi:MAG: DUF1963 domain-containing protein [Myxococcales bacterium]|nr:DUF1963 domain-containing protein [Myxococcales bacterium]
MKPHQRAIEATARRAAHLHRTPAATGPLESKMGGVPYFPFDAPLDQGPDFRAAPTPWPKHPETGRELPLLLQVNFAEMPAIPSFPSGGLLQLYVDDHDWHGLDRHLRVVYHPAVDVVPDPRLHFQELGAAPEFRVTESRLHFTAVDELMGEADFRFAQTYAGTSFTAAELSRTRRDYLSITDHRFVHDPELGRGRNKLGGYHYSQNAQDPRTGFEGWEDSVLLLQLQDYGELSWGDGGAAQWFIRRVDLEACDFSDLLFHWDST